MSQSEKKWLSVSGCWKLQVSVEQGRLDGCRDFQGQEVLHVFLRQGEGAERKGTIRYQPSGEGECIFTLPLEGAEGHIFPEVRVSVKATIHYEVATIVVAIRKKSDPLTFHFAEGKSKTAATPAKRPFPATTAEQAVAA